MGTLRLIDLHFAGREHAIGVYVVETDDGLALFDCGPTSTLPALHDGLAAHGLELSDVRHLLLSHIHLDHAGAAGLARTSSSGADRVGLGRRRAASRRSLPARALGAAGCTAISSTRSGASSRLYPRATSAIAGADVLGWECFPTRGHASHHISYFRDGTLLAGDAAGVRMPGSRYVLPVSPPPDIDVEAWHETAAAIRARERPSASR